MLTTQERLQMAKASLAKNLETLELWENEVRNSPTNQEKKYQLEHVKGMVEKAREAVKRAEEVAELAANPTTPQAKKDLKRLEEINKEGLAMTHEITNAAEDLGREITRWQELQAESKRLAAMYDKKPFDLGIAGSRLGSLGRAVNYWVQEVRTWEPDKWRR